MPRFTVTLSNTLQLSCRNAPASTDWVSLRAPFSHTGSSGPTSTP